MNQGPATKAFAPQDDEIDLSAIVDQLAENKWLILLVTLVTLSIGIFYASRQVPQYQSDVLLQIDSGQSGLGPTGPVAQQFLFRSAGAEATSSQIALMQSRFILEPVINQLGLDISVIPAKGAFWTRWFARSKNTIEVKQFEVPREHINQAYKLVIDKPGHIQLYNTNGLLLLQGQLGHKLFSQDKRIRLQVGSTNAVVGSTFSLIKRSDLVVVKKLAKQLKIDESGAKTRQATGILELSLSGADPAKIVRILNAIAHVAQTKDAQKKSQEAAQTLKFLYHQLPITKGLLEKAESALNQYRAKSGKIDIKLQTQFLLNQLSDLDKQLGVLRISKIDMLQKYTALHPILIASETQIKALESQRDQLEARLRKLPASDQIAVNLMREVGVKKTLYLILLSKIQELEVVKAGTVSGVHVLAFASLPDAPLPNKRAMIYMASTLLGLILSVLLIMGRKLISPRVDDPHWGERQFN